MLLGSALLARRNLRAGRADARGAGRLAAFAAGAAAVAILAQSDLPLNVVGVFAGVMVAAKDAALWAAVTWLFYLAIEPTIRRHRPELLISWSRAVAGEFADPLLGRDLLTGGLAGLVTASAIWLSGWLKDLTHHPLKPNSYLDEVVLDSLPDAIAVGLRGLMIALLWTLLVLAFVTLVRRLIQRPAIALLAIWALVCGLQIAVFARSWPVVVATGLIEAISLAVLFRRGMLAGFTTRFVHALAILFPLTTDFSAPYLHNSWVAIAPILGLVGWGAWAAMGSQRAIVLGDP